MKSRENEKDVKGVAHTHFDSTNPFRFLEGTEFSPFFAYGRLVAGALLNRARHSSYRPKGGQSDGKESQDKHGWTGDGTNVGEDSSQFIVL